MSKNNEFNTSTTTTSTSEEEGYSTVYLDYDNLPLTITGGTTATPYVTTIDGTTTASNWTSGYRYSWFSTGSDVLMGILNRVYPNINKLTSSYGAIEIAEIESKVMIPKQGSQNDPNYLTNLFLTMLIAVTEFEN